MDLQIYCTDCARITDVIKQIVNIFNLWIIIIFSYAQQALQILVYLISDDRLASRKGFPIPVIRHRYIEKEFSANVQ